MYTTYPSAAAAAFDEQGFSSMLKNTTRDIHHFEQKNSAIASIAVVEQLQLDAGDASSNPLDPACLGMLRRNVYKVGDAFTNTQTDLSLQGTFRYRLRVKHLRNFG